MARLASVAKIKGKWHQGHEYPAPGSLTRRVFDQLYERRGEFVTITGLRGHELHDLIDFWGMDIRSIKISKREWRYCLAGEWFGKAYVDYVAEVINGKRQRQNEVSPKADPRSVLTA